MKRVTIDILLVMMMAAAAVAGGRGTGFVRPSVAQACAVAGYEQVTSPPSERALYQYSHAWWGTREGLPQNSIQALLQSRDGYLWIGTQEGLVRFDGTRFRSFDRSNVPEMSHNDVMALAETPEGDLLVGTSVEGLFLFHRGIEPSAERFAPQAGSSISTLAYAPDGVLWVGTIGDGLVRMDADGLLHRFGPESGVAGSHIQSLLVMPDGAVWAGTPEGLIHLEAGGSRFLQVPALRGFNVQALAADIEGTVWAGTSRGLLRLQEDGSVRRYERQQGLPGVNVLSLQADPRGSLWVGTQGGLARVQGESISSFTPRHGLSGDRLVSLLVDREGSLWAGTDAAGLNQLRPSRLTSYTIYHGLANDIVYAVAGSPDGRFWTGSAYGDIDRWTGARFEPVISGDRLDNTRVRTLHEAADGTLWIGTNEHLYRWHDNRLDRFGTEQGLPRAPLRVIFEDRQGTLWIGTDGAGLYRLRGERFEPLPDPQGVIPGQIRAMIEDDRGALWIGTYRGLVRRQAGALTVYTAADGLPNELVRTLHAASDGALWIGTYGGGISRLRDGGFLSLTGRQGLLSDTVFQILEDTAGDLWMSSNRGIFRVRRDQVEAFAAGRLAQLTPDVFTEADGMQNRECNGGYLAGWRSPVDGSMWFPTVGGMVQVELERLAVNPLEPALALEEVIVDGRRYDPARPIVLSPYPHRTEFHFTALTFINSDRALYRYRLLGFDTEWSQTGAARSVHYTRLKPGDYRFEVTAANSDGIWNREGIAVALHVQPAFVQTGWFAVLLALGSVLIVVGIVRRRTFALQRRERFLKSKVDEALARVTTLTGMLPICLHCKKIRDDRGFWSQVEEYVSRHSQAEFSHGLCPACLEKHYPDYAPDVLSPITHQDLPGDQVPPGEEST